MPRHSARLFKSAFAVGLMVVPLLSLASKYPTQSHRSTDYAKMVQLLNANLSEEADFDEQQAFVDMLRDKYRTECRVVVVEQVVGGELFAERAEYDSLTVYLNNIATMAYLKRKPEVLFLFYHSDSLFLKEMIEPR